VTNQCTRAVKRLYRWAKLPCPLADVVTPPAGERTRVLSRGEWRRLRRAAGAELRRVLWFLVQTGARPKEIRELRWGEACEAERVIRLPKFKARDRRRDGVKVRLIPLSAAAARVLARWRAARRPGPDEPVFANEKGRPWTSGTLRLAVGRAAKRAGLNPPDGGERAVTYTLRHTFATRAVANGIQETLLADIMGHTSLTTTRRYLHRGPAELAAGLDRALGRRAKTG
jgi:integrase